MRPPVCLPAAMFWHDRLTASDKSAEVIPPVTIDALDHGIPCNSYPLFNISPYWTHVIAQIVFIYRDYKQLD